MDVIEAIEKEQMRLDIPDFKPGDTVRVHARIKEGEKERIQIFQGVVLRKRKGGTGGDFYGSQSLIWNWCGKDFSPSLT